LAKQDTPGNRPWTAKTGSRAEPKRETSAGGKKRGGVIREAKTLSRESGAFSGFLVRILR